jgi:hypothetical protein
MTVKKSLRHVLGLPTPRSERHPSLGPNTGF